MDEWLATLADTTTPWDDAHLHALHDLLLLSPTHPLPLPAHARGIAWRFYLNVLPPTREGGAAKARDKADWPARLQAARQQYSEWKEQLYPDFNRVSKEGDDDPLSALTARDEEEEEEEEEEEDGRMDASTSSRSRRGRRGGGGGGGGSGAWKRYYEGLELLEEIKRDLTRLYPSGVDEAHFMHPKTQEILLAGR